MTFRKVKQYASSREYKDFAKSIEKQGRLSRREADKQIRKWKREQQEKENKQRRVEEQTQQRENGQDIALARKAGYVQGVCECALVVSKDKMLTKKLLSEMGVTRDMAQKFAKPETFKEMEQSVYVQKNERSLEHKNHIKL
ncbi:MAG: hypothetical protein MdMp014T_1178 [Treponematales bacterium]